MIYVILSTEISSCKDLGQLSQADQRCAGQVDYWLSYKGFYKISDAPPWRWAQAAVVVLFTYNTNENVPVTVAQTTDIEGCKQVFSVQLENCNQWEKLWTKLEVQQECRRLRFHGDACWVKCFGKVCWQWSGWYLSFIVCDQTRITSCLCYLLNIR